MRDDPRYIALRKGIEQLNHSQVDFLVDHIQSGKPIVLDTFNYDPDTSTWCPLAVALNIEQRIRDFSLEVRTDNEAKLLIVKIGKETNPNFTLNPMSGIQGIFFTTRRRSDLLEVCRNVLTEGTGYQHERN